MQRPPWETLQRNKILGKCGLRFPQSTVLYIRALVWTCPASPNICSKYLYLSKAGLRLRAEGILIPTPAHSPVRYP